jgi:pimeloyl-ACP methyl ester carboxylesterase
VKVILDWLDIDRVLVAGISGGGPHALATAAVLPDRVSAVASIAGLAQFGVPDLDFLSGMGDDNLDEFGAAMDGQGALRAYLEGEASKLVGVSATEIAKSMISLLPPIDSDLVTGSLADEYALQFSEGLKSGVWGWLDDDLAFIKPWGFDLNLLDKVPISIWQGRLDLMVPEQHGHWLAKHLPQARNHILANDGHLSIFVGRIGEIVDELLVED